jgi:hypothetical protein
MSTELEYNGRTFESAEALHEWLLIFDFEYFLDYSSQF